MLLMLIASASADVCFADAYGVRRHSPDAWPSWTYRMSGHKGERCYYASTKGNAHRHSRIAQLASERRTLTAGAPGSNPGAAAKKSITKTQPIFDERWAPVPKPDLNEFESWSKRLF